jgi:hypothetical protein
MRKITLTILTLCALVVGAHGAVSETALIHRWTFSENGSSFHDTVGGATLSALGTYHNIYQNTNGAVPGVRLAAPSDTSKHGYLFCDASKLDLAGRTSLTVELIFSDYHAVAANKYANVMTIVEDHDLHAPGGPYQVGLSIQKNLATQNRYWMFNRDADGGIGTGGYTDLTYVNQVGQLTKAVWVMDTLTTASRVYLASIEDATIGSARYSYTSQEVDALDGFNLIIGDSLQYAGEVYVVELRIYGDALDADTLAVNHTADILQYGTTTPIDVYVDNDASAEGYGSIRSPLKTLTEAWRRVSPGSTIRFLRAGEYAGGQQVSGVFAGGPSSDDNVTLLGLEADPDGVVLMGTASTTYPLRLSRGSGWAARYLKFDADSLASYCVYVEDSIASVSFDVCTFTNTKDAASSGSGIMSRAMATMVDSCTFSDIEEHGVYLRNYNAQHDYGHDTKAATVSSVTNCTFTDWDTYAIQISNEGDTTYCYNSLLIANNYAHSPKDTGSSGFYIGGTDTAYVRDNIIVLNESTNAGIHFGAAPVTAAEDGYVYNNDISSAAYGLISGNNDNGYKSYGMNIYNNYLVDCTTDFVPQAATLYHLRNCISTGANTPFPDSTGVQEKEITPAIRKFGGFGPLTGLTATPKGFYPIGARTLTQTLSTPGDPVISAAQSGAGFRTPVEAFRFIRDAEIGAGYELDMYIGSGGYADAGKANLDIWLHGTGETGDGTTAGTTWEAAAFDTLKIVRVQ